MTISEAATRGVVGVTDYRPVASYGRISKRTKGDGAGAFVKIEKQHEDNTAYINAHYPGAPVAYYEDNMSAWDPDVIRPDWERLMTDVKAGNLRACVAWHADRYTRQPLQLELFWQACKATRTDYHTVRGGLVTNPLMVRIEGALSANDSDLKSEKISRRHQTLAEEGKPHGGRRRFGYTSKMEPLTAELIRSRDDLDGMHPEAELVVEMCARFIEGETLFSLAASLQARGVTGTSGGTITGSNLAKILGAPHIAGLRTHTVGKVTNVYPATWTPLISVNDHEAIRHILSDPSRKKAGSNARVHVLSGLMVCDECGAPLRGRPLYKGEGRAYACSTGRHCHRPTLVVDRQVQKLVVKRLERLDASGVFIDTEAENLAERLELDREALIARRAAATDRWSAGLVEDVAHDRNMAALDKREAVIVAELQAARAAVRPVAALEGMTGPDAEARWEAASLDRKRAVLGILFESLSLVGAQHGREPFKPEHVRYVWREVPGAA